MWLQIKESATPAMGRVEEAMRDGRRLLALQRLAGVQPDLEASKYLGRLPAAERKSDAAFEAAWARMGTDLATELGAPSPKALDGVTPAAVRAVGEASVPAVRVFYEASLEYERNTMPEVGFYYLGVAQAQRDLAVFCRTLSTPSALRPAAGAQPPGRARRARRGAPVRLPAPGLDRQAPRVHRGELDAEGGARARRRRAFVRGDAALPPGGPARRTPVRPRPLAHDRSGEGAPRGIPPAAVRDRRGGPEHRADVPRGRRGRRPRPPPRGPPPRRPRRSWPRSCRATSRRSSRPGPARRPPPATVTVTLVRWPYT